uniref:Uncharacterized protein n=1 Tax=Palmerella debilis subsp. serrata TaxID=2010905 RepID=A0A1Z2R5V6_9ASTR|nr:hypothetical protein Pa_de_se1Pt0325 [Palmerella debilis subsp. serrata]
MWIALYNRLLHRAQGKCLCCTKGGTLPSANNDGAVYQIFSLIWLKMGRCEIISSLWQKFASRNGDASGSIIDFAKAEGANWVAERKNFFFRNAASIQATKACLWGQLHANLLERTNQRDYDIRVGFWSGAWKRFLFEGEGPFSDSTSNLDFVARNSLREALRTKIRNKPDHLDNYQPYLHAWLRVRSDFISTLEVLDKCDAQYQKYRADYLVAKTTKIFFRDVYWFLLDDDEFLNSEFGLLNEEEFRNLCFHAIGEEQFLNLCLETHDREGEVRPSDEYFFDKE